MGGPGLVALGAAAFVGTHLLMSHPLRRPLVAVLGEKGFSGLYSLVAAATLGLTIWAYARAPVGTPLWAVGQGLWVVATVLMLLASVLLAGSVTGNPALSGPGRMMRVPAEARGVFAVTRHPMLWSFAIWGISHALVWPVGKNLVLAGAMAGLSLVGAAGQDRKKRRLDPSGWPVWEGRTGYWPFAAVLAGQARLHGFGGLALGGGVVVWLAATWVHIPLAGWRAGIWRWIGF
ncbi:MAG: MFS transporter [Gluconacetobacter diazotrophicus]|nr:MFS transporter [Gluconacetobacter diazotrophicus]